MTDLDKKELLILTHLFSNSGGVETYIDTIAREYVKRGNKVTVISLCGTVENSADYPYTIEILENQNMYSLKYAYLMKSAQKKWQNIYQQYQNVDTLVTNPLVFLAIKNNVNFNRLVVQFHGKFEYSKQFSVLGKLYQGLISKYYKKAKYFSVLSEVDAKKFSEVGFHNVCVVNNPIRFNLQQIDIKTYLQRPQKIVFIGRLTAVKQIDHIIQAYAKLPAEYKKAWCLEIYGDGEEADKLKKMKIKLNEENIYFKGNTQQVDEVMKQSQVMILSSKAEGLPMTLLEALAFGVPMVSYPISAGVLSVVVDGLTGKVASQNDVQALSNVLAEVLRNEELRLHLAQECLKRREMFSKENTVDQISQLFDENGG